VDQRDRWPKKGLTFPVRTAEQPGQALNADLCFVPATHPAASHLPAVSGSSGRLVVASARPDRPPSHPGQLFAEPDRPYAEAMHAFVAASPPRSRSAQPAALPPAPPDAPASRPSVRQQTETLRSSRRALRQQRLAEDALWRRMRHQQYRPLSAPAEALDLAVPPPTVAPLPKAVWRALRLTRRAQLQQRADEDALWRAARQHIREQLSPAAPAREWIAILVLTDNCTRQCCGLPLFTAGASVTAEQVVAALRTLLPPELQFLISDRGTHFTANAFARLASDAAFVHVLIARHRPQSNGIAERFVQTLKGWLADKLWTTVDELAALLARFRAEYNERPHQGLGIPGLSPNEFANRIWLL
jgi:transposase InsO family protein